MSLLERAKEVSIHKPPRNHRSVEEMELAVAWAMGEVTTAQVGEVIRKRHASSATTWLFNRLLWAVQNRLLVPSKSERLQ